MDIRKILVLAGVAVGGYFLYKKFFVTGKAAALSSNIQSKVREVFA